MNRRRALRLFFEAEQAFGMDDHPRAASAVPAPKVSSAPGRPEPAATDSPSARERVEAIAEKIRACTACPLHAGRIQAVPGQGAAPARLMFVGEGPGAEEDKQGLAFVGRSGELLTKMIAAMGLSRDEVFIGNMVRCRPPGNRDPLPEEINACYHFIAEQIDAVSPEVICTLGRCASNGLLGRDDPIGRLRGRVYTVQGVQVVPTYHPSYLLRSPGMKGRAWEDLQVVMQLLGIRRPGASS